MPGMAKMLSVMTAPDSMLESCSAIIVMTGSIEFFSAWPRMTAPRPSPLARAVSM